MLPRETQNEPGGQPVTHLNNLRQPVPILWLEDVRSEALNIRHIVCRDCASHLPPPSGEKCGKRLPLRIPGGFQQKSNRFHGRNLRLKSSRRHKTYL
jgi:hypothetical protein